MKTYTVRVNVEVLVTTEATSHDGAERETLEFLEDVLKDMAFDVASYSIEEVREHV